MRTRQGFQAGGLNAKNFSTAATYQAKGRVSLIGQTEVSVALVLVAQGSIYECQPTANFPNQQLKYI